MYQKNACCNKVVIKQAFSYFGNSKSNIGLVMMF